MGRRKTAEDYHVLAGYRNFEWIGKGLPKNVLTKTRWRCSKNHEWETWYNAILQGNGCPKCAGHARITEEDYHILAKSRNFEWIGEFPKSTVTRTEWRCLRGHRWKGRYHDIKYGAGCPYCACRVSKTEKDYYDLAESRNFEWIGKLPGKTHVKTKWQCGECGYKWSASYNSIQRGCGCLNCAGNMCRTEKDYYALAANRNFEWIGRFPKNTKINTRWRCSKNHEWLATYNNIHQGSNCPECLNFVNGRRVSQVQRHLCEMLDGALNHPFGRRRIDVALLDKMIAVECDSWYWHGDRMEKDAWRDEELIAANWKVLHIKSNALLPPKQQLDETIAELENSKVTVTEIVLPDWGMKETFCFRGLSEEGRRLLRSVSLN